MYKANQVSAIPPVFSLSGNWCIGAHDKAQAFADCFSNKYVMPEIAINRYTHITNSNAGSMSVFLPIRPRHALNILKKLREDSGTGPDLLSAKVLRKCYRVLAVPIVLLCRLILSSGQWPAQWKLHWIYPLYKKSARSNPGNYHGIHLTPQLSKVVERVFAIHLTTFFESSGAYGDHQFAYIHKRGYRDALTFNVCTWIWALGIGKRVALYCSDVSGAFDRVRAERLLLKLEAKGVHKQMLAVLSSWLQTRAARICVDGSFSDSFPLSDMVFQGTVLGPPLWNCFYADAAEAVEVHHFLATIFADDLNCFRIFDGRHGDDLLMQEAHKCQTELHIWGQANQVVFEPTKESFHILGRVHSLGESFKILSVLFDTKLSMHEAANDFASEAGWRLRTLMRTRRFYDVANMVRLYKTHILSYIEGATPAIYHAAPSVLKPLDDLQSSFLLHLNITDTQAFLDHGLAPLSMRRDIAMLGLLFKVASGIAPAPISQLFRPFGGSLISHGFRTSDVIHSKALMDPVEPSHPVIIKRSIFGLIRVYNLLPQATVDAKSTKLFQRGLQNCAKTAAKNGAPNWQSFFGITL